MNNDEFNFPEDMSGRARSTDPETSHIAAAMVDMAHGVQDTYWAMYKFGRDGCIADDIEIALDLRSGSNNPRYKPMVRLGMIEIVMDQETGKPKKRKGPICGRLQIVRRVLPPPFITVEKKRKIVPSLPQDEPGKRVKYFQTQEGLDWFVKTLSEWKLKPGLNIRITIEVVK